MYHTVNIEGYRGFDRFEMTNLGRVNLLVGRNNSGKTSVLEALHLLSYGADLTALWQICGRRGERVSEERERYPGDIEIDISHLFTGHEMQVGSKFTIGARNEIPPRYVSYEIDLPTKQERAEDKTPPPPDEPLRPRMTLRIHSSAPLPSRAYSLTRRGGITYDYVETPRRVVQGRRAQEFVPTSHFISTESLTGDELIRMWDKVQLTPDEDLVLQALMSIDPNIQQLRAVGSRQYYGTRGGFIIKRSDYRMPFPLGSLGDGAWRMLAMAIVVSQCREGVLLIDEIDTGLHYTVMADMWRLILTAARNFNVQVFATTHSFDCVHSLSRLYGEAGHGEDGITIHRIEEHRKKAIAFTGEQIRMIAERDIEVR
jgi:hypothetical protein